MHGLESFAARLRRLGQLNKAAGAIRYNDSRAGGLDIFSLLFEDLLSNFRIVHMEGACPAAACPCFRHLNKFSRCPEKLPWLFLNALTPHEMAGVVVREPDSCILPGRIANFHEVFRQVHHLAAEGGSAVLPERIIFEVGADVLESAAAACTIAHNNVCILVKADVFPGERQEFFTHAMGKVRQTATHIIFYYDRG